MKMSIISPKKRKQLKVFLNMYKALLWKNSKKVEIEHTKDY